MKLSISMTEREKMLGWWFFLLYIFVLPVVVDFIGRFLNLSLSALNILFFTLNFLCAVGVFYRFFWESMKSAWATWKKCLRFTLTGLGMHFACALLVSAIIAPWVGPWFSNVNDDMIIEMSKTHTLLFAFCTIVLVPVTEEILFRGLVFGTLCKKNPRFALCVSVLLFASIHLMDYIGTADWKTLLACLLQYLPAGFALAWAYANSENIVVPIFMHIINNAIAMVTLR